MRLKTDSLNGIISLVSLTIMSSTGNWQENVGCYITLPEKDQTHTWPRWNIGSFRRWCGWWWNLTIDGYQMFYKMITLMLTFYLFPFNILVNTFYEGTRLDLFLLFLDPYITSERTWTWGRLSFWINYRWITGRFWYGTEYWN